MDQIKRNLYELLFSCKGNWRIRLRIRRLTTPLMHFGLPTDITPGCAVRSVKQRPRLSVYAGASRI